MKKMARELGTAAGFTGTVTTRGTGWVWRALMVAGLSVAPLVAGAATISESTLFGFNAADGNQPGGQMIQASDGNYYGATCEGGASAGSNSGVIWKITPAGQQTVLHSFAATTEDADGDLINADGDCPQGVVQGLDGHLYGVTLDGGASGGGVAFTLALDGSSFSVMHQFGSLHSDNPAISQDGIFPHGIMIQGADSNFYGTTLDGGTVDGHGGTIFLLNPNGEYRLLHSFGHSDDTGPLVDGAGPIGNLLQGADGNLYGVTFQGGVRNAARDGSADDSGGGVAYRFDLSTSTLTVLHAFKIFDGDTGDGYEPFTNLVETADGAFYGMTAFGGSAHQDNGTLFRISSSGGFTLLSSFTVGNSNGTPPQPRGLTLGSDGNIYGTTLQSANGSGSVFRLAPNNDGAPAGTLTTLYQFAGPGVTGDGTTPNGPLVQGSDGSFLGTLLGDGPNSNSSGGGAVFRLAASPALAAPVQLTVDHATLTKGQSPAQTATLSWNVANATSQTYSTCFASDSWSGSRGPSGSQVVVSSASGTPGTYRFALTCGGVETGFATLTILPAAAPPPAPTVTISANPASIRLGSNTTLTWSSTNATACNASGAWSGSVGTSGSLSQRPAATGTSTFTLTCTGDGGSATGSASVTVTPVPVAPTVTITANPSSLQVGMSSAIGWTSTDATACTASGAWSGSRPTNGFFGFAATTPGSFSFTLTCTGDGGSATATAVLTVAAVPPPPPAPTVRLSVAPQSITLGASATLTWSSTNATACTASGAWQGAEATAGTLLVQPAEVGSFTYVLDCSGNDATAESSATLTVVAVTPPPPPPAPTLSIGLSATRITLGGSTTLTWASVNASACVASGGWSGAQAVSGSLSETPLAVGDIVYALSCTGEGGSVAHSVTLHVDAAGPGGKLDAKVKAGAGAFGLPWLAGLLGLAGLRRRRKAATLLAALALAAAGSADAAGTSADTEGLADHLYAGVRVGVMSFDVDSGRLQRDLAQAGFQVGIHESHDALAGTLYLGYTVDRHVALELGYTHSDHTVLRLTGVTPTRLQRLLDIAAKDVSQYADLYSLSVPLRAELAPDLTLTGRGGVFYWHDRTEASSNGLSAYANHQGGGVTLGSGLSYRIIGGLEIGAGADYYGSKDSFLYAGTLQWNFGNR